MPPPPPMWRRSPPRMRRRYYEWFDQLLFPFVFDICVFYQAYMPFHTYLLIYVFAGPAPQGGDRQHAAALAPDLPVVGVTALVPAPTPLDRWVFVLYAISHGAESASFLDSSVFMWAQQNSLICIVANMDISLIVLFVQHFFSMFCISLFWKARPVCVFLGWACSAYRSTSLRACLLFTLSWIFRHFEK